MNSITYVIDGGITSLLFSPTRMPENHESIKLNACWSAYLNIEYIEKDYILVLIK